MAEGGLQNEDYLRFVAADSQNVSDEGNFSIQVLSEALKVYNIRCVPVGSSEVVGVTSETYHMQEAFICNLSSHWFTIRNLGGQWYNLNSLKPVPEKISDFYLSAFLGQLQAEHYTIFVIVGSLPSGEQAAALQDAAPSGKWWTPKELEMKKESLEKESKISEALQNTLQNMQGFLAQTGGQVLSALGSGGRGGGGAAGTSGVGGNGDDEDADLRAAIAASLSDAAGMAATAEGGGAAQGEAGAGASATGEVGGRENPAYRQNTSASEAELQQALALSLEEFNRGKDTDDKQPKGG